MVREALKRAGVTQERVEAWVGAPCGCEERVTKLNIINSWVLSVLGGKVEGAAQLMEGILTKEK